MSKIKKKLSGMQKIFQPKIYENRFVFINGYSFMHIIIFFLIGIIFQNKWIFVIIGILTFEIFEFVMARRGGIDFLNWHPIISKKDMLNDIFFDMLGYWLAHY